MRRRLIVLLAILALLPLICWLAWAKGRALWHPLLVRVQGERSIADRLEEIAGRHPDLRAVRPRAVAILAFKAERRLEVHLDGRPWRTFPVLAASGGPGPKLRQGDRQVPEGIYAIDAVNPNSSYHLSLRVSYPNAEDRRRSAAAGVADPGGDIYIHGKDASIGCLAIGDDAIEQVFWVANQVDPRRVEVVIAPCDPERPLPGLALPDHPELYRAIAEAVRRLRAGG